MKIVKSKFKMLLILLVVFNSINSLAQKYEVLIVTGQNNHYWQGSSKIVAKTFNNSDLFNATVIVSPSKGEDMSEFSPKFKKYDLVCLDYNGDYWSDKTQNKFLNEHLQILYYLSNTNFRIRNFKESQSYLEAMHAFMSLNAKKYKRSFDLFLFIAS